jgi:hypothetical protein
VSRSAWTEFVRKRPGGVRVPPVVTERVGGKFGNRVTVVDGLKFSSRLEADRYRELAKLVQWGQVKYFVRQVPFDVAPGVVYRADFLVVWNRIGKPLEIVEIEDTKGYLTATSRTKIAVVQARYGIPIKILRRGDVSRCPKSQLSVPPIADSMP